MPSKMTTARKQAQKARRTVRPRMVRGHGSYSMPPEQNPNKAVVVSVPKQPGNVNKFARAAGEALGQSISYIPGLGKLIPAPLISAASSALGDAGSWLARAFGFGRYDVKSNTLYKKPRITRGGPGGAQVEEMPYVASPPSFGSSKKGSDIIFAHREYIGDVKSSINFRATTYPINPGNNVMYPWMSRIASLFEEYELLGQIFEYRSTSATAVGTTSSGMGVVVMATDYDCYDSNFTTKRQMEAAEYSSAAVPFETFLHPIECDRSRNVLAQQYVVPGITKYDDAPGDARMSVHGNFTIATEGQQVDDTTIGELWVTYHIKLSRPVLETTASPASVYTVILSAFAQDTGNVSSAVQKVSQGLPGFSLSQAGTGATSRFRFSNSTSKARGHFILTWSTRFIATYSPVVPTLLLPTYGGAATEYQVYNPYNQTTGVAWTNSMPIVQNGVNLYCYEYTTCFTLNSDADYIEIPVVHASDIAGFVSCTITQMGGGLAAIEQARPTGQREVLPPVQPDTSAAAAASSEPTPGCWEDNEHENDLYQKMIEKQRAAAYARPALTTTKK